MQLYEALADQLTDIVTNAVSVHIFPRYFDIN